MEGILGALYVSDNCTLQGAEEFFNKVFKPFFDEFVAFETLARHATDAVLEMLRQLGCREYSSVRNVENGVHSCKSEPSFFLSDHFSLKRNSHLAREHSLRSQTRQFGRSNTKGERKVLADVDGKTQALG
jgi:hypothetical protein